MDAWKHGCRIQLGASEPVAYRLVSFKTWVMYSTENVGFIGKMDHSLGCIHFGIRNWSHVATHVVVVLVFLLVWWTLEKNARLHLFKLDRDEILRVCSSIKYASIGGVGFL